MRGADLKELTDVRDSPTGSAELTCLNCGAPRIGRYCTACGQDGERRLATLTDLARRIFSEVTDVDGTLLRTFRLLFRRPGQLSREYSEGRFRGQVPPTRLYLASVAAYFLLTPFLGAPEVRSGGQNGDVTVSSYVGPFLWDSELLFGALVPLWALAVLVGLDRKKRRYEEAFVLSVHYHVFFLACMLVIVLLIAISDVISSPLLAKSFVTIGSFAPLLYLHAALRRAFGLKLLRGAITAGALFIVHLFVGELLFRFL